MTEEIDNEIQVKSRQRVADHGEVFTAQREVNAMLDLGDKAFIPTPVGNFPLTHFLKLSESEFSELKDIQDE